MRLCFILNFILNCTLINRYKCLLNFKSSEKLPDFFFYVINRVSDIRCFHGELQKDSWKWFSGIWIASVSFLYRRLIVWEAAFEILIKRTEISEIYETFDVKMTLTKVKTIFDIKSVYLRKNKKRFKYASLRLRFYVTVKCKDLPCDQQCDRWW